MPDIADAVHDLGPEIDGLRRTIRGFAEAKVAPIAERIDREGFFPRHLWPELGALGLHGITAEEEYGGANAGYLAHMVAAEEIGRASGSIALSYLAHSNLCINQLTLNGNPAQKAKYLPPLISGEHVGALAMSEPEAGSDVMSLRLRAVQAPGGWRLTGSKMWITNGPEAETLVIYARTDPDAASRNITAFIVEKGFPGFTIAQTLDKLGNRGSPTGELVFDDCFVPDANVLGTVGGGTRVLMSGLVYERVIAAAIPIGLMQACLDLALSYSRERRQFGRPIGSFQLMQGRLADMFTRLASSRAYAYAVARACDQPATDSRAMRRDSAALLLLCAENATWVADQTIQVLGGNGYINDYPAGRLWRDAKVYEIGAGTTDIRRWLIGRELVEEAG